MAQRNWTTSFFDRSYVDLLAAQKDARTTRQEVDFLCEALAIEPPARVLDVACGFGRHATALARRGFDVLGVDNSPAMVAEATRRAGGIRGVRFERRDMRRLAVRGAFDAVINMFTSFGYFSHRENLQALRAMARALRPGGRIVIETIDRRALARQLARNSTNRIWWPVSDDFYVLEDVRFDAARGMLHSDWQVLQRRGRGWTLTPKRIRLRLYDAVEWRRLLEAANLRRLAVYRGLGRKPDERMASVRRVQVARRKHARNRG